MDGLTGTVTDVNVTLGDLTYELNGPPDADIVLVAPGGKAIMLMSDACGDNDSYNPITSPVTLVFDDEANGGLPADAACGGGTFRPVDDDDDGEFPFHQPDEFPGGPPAPPSTLPLSTFDGIAPNGAWSLYVVDDYPNDPDPQGRSGQIGGGWSIDISTTAGAGTATTSAPGAGTAATPPTTAATAESAPPPEPAQSSEPTSPSATEPGDFEALADIEGSGGTVLWAVVGLLVVGALALMAMIRPGGWRLWRR